jgi:hypothetical protein
LLEIFAPPTMAANGPRGLGERAAQVLELLLHEEPGRGGLERSGTPTVEACARCAVPNASLT